MSEQADKLRRDVNRVFFWSFAALVLGTWALCGFLPLAGLLIEGASIGFLVAQLVFLFTGFVGVASLVMLGQIVTLRGGGNTARRMLRGRAGWLTAYALAWLSAYAIFIYLT